MRDQYWLCQTLSWFVMTAYRKLPGHEHTRVMALPRPQILVIAPPALLMIPTPLPLLPPCEQTRARYSCISCSRVYYQPTFPRGSSSLLTPIRRHPISRPTRLDQGPSLIPTQTKVQVENYRQMTVSSLLPRINKGPRVIANPLLLFKNHILLTCFFSLWDKTLNVCKYMFQNHGCLKVEALLLLETTTSS